MSYIRRRCWPHGMSRISSSHIVSAPSSHALRTSTQAVPSSSVLSGTTASSMVASPPPKNPSCSSDMANHGTGYRIGAKRMFGKGLPPGMHLAQPWPNYPARHD